MKRTLLTVLLAIILFHLPYRLVGLSMETFLIRPGGAHLATDNARYWDAISLETRLIGLGWSVAYRPSLHYGMVPAYGLTSPQEHSITIDSTLSWSARAAILAHEGGHTLQPIWMSNQEGECFAEGVATILMQDSLREHARYLAAIRWTCVGVFIAEYRAIYRAAALLQN